MKDRERLAGMLVIVLFVVVIIGRGTVFAQTGDQPAPAAMVEAQPAPVVRPSELLNTAKKLRLQIEGYMGMGLDSTTVGVNSYGDDVKISAGGGFGYGATMGYGLSRSVDIDGTLGFQASGLYPYVKNADGYFARTFLLATVKYKVPFRENLQWKFGLGAGYYIGGKLDIEIDPGVPGAGHRVVDYKNATGMHATGGLEIALQRNLMLDVGLKYYRVTYKADTATFNGASVPVSSLSGEFREFTGDGVDVTAGIAVLF